MATITTCPSCGGNVSPKAFDCPHCGHPLRKPRRGFFGTIFKWLFIGWNIIMVVWLFGYAGQVAELSNEATTAAERTGTEIGAGIGVAMILIVWALGTVIFGLLTLLTRPSK
ncbi:MAG: hypothetical protein AAGG09_06470 [Pseudomonadota bacterium]